MLIEVMISALLVALIVVATLNGFDVTSRATASERARAQADALAQQAEDKLRGLSLAELETLESKPLVEEPTQNGTKYKVTSTAVYYVDATATASCTSSVAGGGYYRTISTVDWPSRGVRPKVVETGIISPPPGSALIVQVNNASGEGVAGMTVTATGPAPAATEHTLETAANGCATLALLPGEYTINVKKAGYVDENWYAESKADLHSIQSVYLVAETAAKEPYSFAPAGTLKVKFSGSKPEEGDSFVAFNSGMTINPALKQVGTVGKYAPAVESTTVYPFGTKYAVYAGTCEQNNPVIVNPANPAPPEVLVPAGGKVEATVTQPPINIKVMSGKSKASPGLAIENAIVTLTDIDEGCNNVKHESKTNAKGGLPRPGAPYGEYSLCVTGGKEGGNNGATKGLAKGRKYTTTFENDTPTGLSKTQQEKFNSKEVSEEAAVIYMEAGAPETPGKLEAEEKCP